MVGWLFEFFQKSTLFYANPPYFFEESMYRVQILRFAQDNQKVK